MESIPLHLIREYQQVYQSLDGTDLLLWDIQSEPPYIQPVFIKKQETCDKSTLTVSVLHSSETQTDSMNSNSLNSHSMNSNSMNSYSINSKELIQEKNSIEVMHSIQEKNSIDLMHSIQEKQEKPLEFDKEFLIQEREWLEYAMEQRRRFLALQMKTSF